jgi:uncharacterized zinc-type alcohol dehydrogenase-like protein
LNLIISTVSTGLDWNLYTPLLTIGGSFVAVGIPDRAIPIEAFPLILGRRSIAGSVIGGIKETQEMLDFCAHHRVTSDVEVIPIDKVNDAFERVLKSDGRGGKGCPTSLPAASNRAWVRTCFLYRHTDVC